MPVPPPVLGADELSRSAYIAQTGAKSAWDQGYTGKGVTVAVIDSGISAQLDEFAGRVHAASGNFSEDDFGEVIKKQPVGDDIGHGTMVASVLAAGANGQKTVGVAPEAGILALGVFSQADVMESGAMWINLERITAALGASRAAGASIVNGSFGLGIDSPLLRESLQQSVAAGQLLVFSAGNDGAPNPSMPARYAREAWANGQIIAVGAVDSRNNIASYSNRAGDAMNAYLVAPGEVVALGKDGETATVAGTSFAAPQVAGAAALLKQKWPRLAASQIATALFETAIDLGDPGTDPIYGRGLLNIARAMQPLGEMTIATPAGGVPLAASGLTLPGGGAAGALAGRLAQSAIGLAAVDSLGRDYVTPLSALVSRRSSDESARLQAGLARDMSGIERSVGGVRLSLMPAQVGAGDLYRTTSRSYFAYTEKYQWQFGGGTSDRLGEFFGLAQKSPGRIHPFMALAGEGNFAGLGRSLDERTRVRAGALVSPSASGQMFDLARGSLGWARGMPESGDWAVALTAGTLSEKKGFLGMTGEGAFALAAGNSRFTTVDGRYWLHPKLEFGGSLTFGRTAADGSGLLRFSPLTTWSAEALVARNDAWVRGDRLSLSLGKPNMVAAGSLDLLLPARIAEDGTMGFRQTEIGLAGGASETRLGLGYAAPLGKGGRVSMTGMQRWHADNQPGRGESLFGLQYRLFY